MTAATMKMLLLRPSRPARTLYVKPKAKKNILLLRPRGLQGPEGPPGPRGLPSTQFVSYEDFPDIDLTGTVPSDAGVKACHDFANANNAKVFQNWGRVLLRGTPNLIDGSPDAVNRINVRTDCDLSGLTVVTDDLSGSTTPTFSAPALYTIDRPEAPVINIGAEDIADLLANHSGELVKGSKYISHPIFVDNEFAFIIFFSHEVDMVRNGNPLRTIFKTDFVVTSRGGNLAVGLERSFTSLTGISVCPKERKRLVFRAPHFEANDTMSVTLILVNRNQTDIEAVSFKEAGGVAPANSVRVLLDWLHCWDVRLNGAQLEAQDNGAADGGTRTASYGIRARVVTGLQIDNAHGYGGWGLTGMDWLKDFTIRNSTVNRIDTHWFSYNCLVDACRLVNIGARATGGGWTFNDCTWAITATVDQSGDVTDAGDAVNTTFFSPRQDYGCDFEGHLTIRNLTIEVGAGFPPDGTLVLARFDEMTSSGNLYDPGRDTSLPQLITIDGVKIKAPSPIGVGAEFRLIAVYMETVSGFGRKIYYPNKIIVKDIDWLNPDPNQRLTVTAVTSFTFADQSVYVLRSSDTAARFGTNVDISVENVKSLNNTNLLASNEGMLINLNKGVDLRAARYTDSDGFHPRISIEDCSPCAITSSANGKIHVTRSTVTRLRTAIGVGTPKVLIRMNMADIKPIDSNATGGATAFFWTNGADVQYFGCAFYIPLDNNGGFVGAISLNNSKGGLNTLQDGAVSGTHYTNVPANFFM
jgi:hypothetical protein